MKNIKYFMMLVLTFASTSMIDAKIDGHRIKKLKIDGHRIKKLFKITDQRGKEIKANLKKCAIKMFSAGIKGDYKGIINEAITSTKVGIENMSNDLNLIGFQKDKILQIADGIGEKAKNLMASNDTAAAKSVLENGHTEIINAAKNAVGEAAAAEAAAAPAAVAAA
jgi:hypothetical protein